MLGFVAYAFGPDCDQAKPGAVVYPAARDRESCDPQYRPPPTLDFEQALAWAVRGGREEEPLSVEAPEPETAQGPSLSAAPHEPTAAERAWATAVTRLQLEMSREVFTTWLLGVTLVSADEATFTLGVRHAYARDWLETRLRPTIQQALRGAVGQTVEGAFVPQPTREHE